MPLEIADESFLSHFRVPPSLQSGTGGGGAKNIDSHLGRGSLHDDDGTVVARTGVRESTRKRKRGGGDLERVPAVGLENVEDEFDRFS